MQPAWASMQTRCMLTALNSTRDAGMGDEKGSGLAEVLSDNAEGILVGVLAVAALAAVVVGGFYVAFFRETPVSGDPASWGQLGDYLGGVLNPVFGFLSVFALLVALVLQTRELKLSRDALEVSQREQAKSAEALALQNRAIQKQGFEQTFFSWLGTYRQILGEVIHGDSKGRRALKDIWNPHLSSEWVYPMVSIMQGGTTSVNAVLHQLGLNSLQDVNVGHYPLIATGCRSSWDTLYNAEVLHLDSLFRVLYRLLKWVDEQPEESFSTADKWLYVGIVRSQLSWIEMVFLFYNGMTDRGGKFKRLIERYALFDNLPVESDKLLMILKECPMDSIGYAPSAFDSEQARKRAAVERDA